MEANDVVREEVERVLATSPAREAISAVDVQADEDHDGLPFLRVNLHIRPRPLQSSEILTPQLSKLMTDVQRAISDVDERYSTIRFPEDP